VSTPNGQHPAQPPAPVSKPLFDTANQFTGEMPVEWTVGAVDFPGGQRAAVCFRVPNTSLTVVMAKDDLGRLISDLQTLRGRMTGLILPGS
jgi:hypothetical protein